VDGLHPQPDDHLLLPLLRSGGAGPAPLHFGDAALPRCWRTATSNKQETIYCYSETERDAASAKLGGKPEITRFKGLGEISPAEFKQFIGKDMRVSRVEYAPKVDSAQILTFYMGKNTPERKDYIMENLVVAVEE
jgi:DNA gyrase/topoisomerase IV subunit B